MDRLRSRPGFCLVRERRVDPHNVLDAPPDHFRKRDFPFVRNPLRLAVKRIRQLDLCFYHDGILPSSRDRVNLFPTPLFFVEPHRTGVDPWPVLKIRNRNDSPAIFRLLFHRGAVILLDTDICVALLRGHRPVLDHRLATADEVAVAFMTAAELFYGAEKSARPLQNRTLVEEFLLTLPVLHTDLAILRRFGALKADIDRSGLPLPDADILIAATALVQADP